MKELEKILDIFPTQNFDRERVKEIAIAYAKVCLEKAAEEAQIRMEFTLSFGEPSVYYVKETEQNNYNLSVHKPSITNIELP